MIMSLGRKIRDSQDGACEVWSIMQFWQAAEWPRIRRFTNNWKRYTIKRAVTCDGSEVGKQYVEGRTDVYDRDGKNR